MNVWFGENHIETLMELQSMAKRHGFTISMGFNSEAIEFDESTRIMFELDASKKVMDEIVDLCEVVPIGAMRSSAWMSLDNGSESHLLNYTEVEGMLKVTHSSLSMPLSDAAEDWLEEHESAYEHEYDLGNDSYFIPLSKKTTSAFGFGGRGKDVEDVYRPGIIVKVFSDLVCDFLHEKRIERVY